MALINCLECEKEYSDLADNCPNCACPSTHNLSSERQGKKTSVEEKKEHTSCDVKINGDEILIKPVMNLSWQGPSIMFGFFAIIAFFQIFMENNDNSLPIFVISFLLSFTMYLFAKPSDKKKQEYARAVRINNYFKTRFPILKEFKPEFTNLGIANAEYRFKQQAMFNVYMQAHKADADAIVLNSDNTSTNVHGEVRGGSGYTSSTTSFHIMATLVKY